MDYRNAFFNDVTPQECWVHSGHILADYLLLPDLTVLFDNRTVLDPGYWHNYKQVRDAYYAEKDEKQKETLKQKRNEIAKEFRQKFAKLLVEFFQLRLLGSQKDMEAYLNRFDKYLELFFNLVGDGDGKTPMLTLTYQFLDMLRDYLLRNCPGLPVKAQDMNANELMQEVRRLYKLCDRNPRYVDLETNSYTAGILNLLDKISRTDTQKLPYSYFLIVSEYLIGLFLYVFMVEHIIYRRELLKGKTAKKAPSLIAQLFTPKPQ